MADAEPEAAGDVALPPSQSVAVLAPASPGASVARANGTANGETRSRLRDALMPRGTRVAPEDTLAPAQVSLTHAPDALDALTVELPAAFITPASLPAAVVETSSPSIAGNDAETSALTVAALSVAPVTEPLAKPRTKRAQQSAQVRPATRMTARDTAGIGARMARWDRQTVSVGAVSLVMGIVAVVVSASRNLLLQYPDARSHLEIARRVFDNRTPGLVQLGTVWLPVPHLLMLPFVNIDPPWTSGLAGSIVGVCCLVVTTVTLFLAVRQLTGRAMPAWLAVLVLLTNPSLLYIQSIALTEPVLLASMTAAAYFLLRWTKDRQTQTLLVAGIFAALAVGSRYDGWFFVVVSALALGLTVLMRRRQWQPEPRYTEQRHSMETQGVMLAYAAVPCYAIALWFLYNWIYFGDPLEFQRGAFSAQQQQKALEVLGQLSTKNNLWLSLRAYFWAMENNTGPVILGLAVIGVIVYLATTRLHSDSYLPYIFLAPIPFNVLALWAGQTIIRVPQLFPGEYFNVRYGLLILPGLALFIAYLYHRLTVKTRNVYVLPFFVAALFVQGMVWWTADFPAQVPVVMEGVNAGAHDGYVIEAAHYLHDTYDGGGILIDDSTTHIMTLARLPMREYVATYSGAPWRAALTDPSPIARYIVVSNNRQDGVVDLLLKTAGQNPYYFADYQKVYTNDGLTIYERKPEITAPGP